MENTALNGTATTEGHEDWKKKKGYGPIIVAVSLALLLGLSFYTGGPVDGGTTLPPFLHRDEKDMQNVAASSSSISLVGSGAAKSSAYCKKNTGYNCGAVFPPDGNTCSHKGCCCRQEDGTGYKMNTCDGTKGYAYRGCNSCLGETACFQTNNIKVGDSSCHGEETCRSVLNSTIDNVSCHGAKACYEVTDSTINEGSCQGEGSCEEVQHSVIGKGSCKDIENNSGNLAMSCYHMKNSTIHDGSCQGDQACDMVKNSIIGKGSCNGGLGYGTNGDWGRYGKNCGLSENITIGNNSCNGVESGTLADLCYKCKHNVPDNACNQGITDDMTGGYCNYCFA